MINEIKSPNEDFVYQRHTTQVRRAIESLPHLPHNKTQAAGYAFIEEVEGVKAKTLQRLKSRKANGRYVAGEIEWISSIFDNWRKHGEAMVEMGLPDGFDWDRDHVYEPMIGPNQWWEIEPHQSCVCALCERQAAFGLGGTMPVEFRDVEIAVAS